MAAQLLSLFLLNPTPMTDRQTRDRQNWAKLVKAVSRRFRRAVEENLVRRDGRTAGDWFQLKAVVRVAISAQSVVSTKNAHLERSNGSRRDFLHYFYLDQCPGPDSIIKLDFLKTFTT